MTVEARCRPADAYLRRHCCCWLGHKLRRREEAFWANARRPMKRAPLERKTIFASRRFTNRLFCPRSTCPPAASALPEKLTISQRRFPDCLASENASYRGNAARAPRIAHHATIYCLQTGAMYLTYRQLERPGHARIEL